MELSKDVCELIFPKHTFDHFDITSSGSDEATVRITFTEKDEPPLEPHHADKKITARKFHEITITDFPLRGKRTLLTFYRRYWKVEGEKTYLKRDIRLTFPGTKLEEEFARFLKEDGGKRTGLTRFYRSVAAPPDERI